MAEKEASEKVAEGRTAQQALQYSRQTLDDLHDGVMKTIAQEWERAEGPNRDVLVGLSAKLHLLTLFERRLQRRAEQGRSAEQKMTEGAADATG